MPIFGAHMSIAGGYHKALLTGLKQLRDDALRGRYLKRDFEPNLKSTIKGCQG